MDRRLWLCDKWVSQIQTEDPKLYDKLKSIVDHMTVFLNYRSKYYGVSATDETNALQGYLDTKDETAIRTKLTEYKAWWTANKGGAININR
ncbi:MAG: hypothetical protein HZA17_00680 [Nitrospirae bacterium]|nr:hypothetical protein [Nitrospirota bacterium]